MDALVVAALGSVKVLVLLLAAWGLSLALRGRPARLRAVVWATALVGSLLIPALAAVVPSFVVELPIELPATGAGRADPPTATAPPVHSHPAPGKTPAAIDPAPIVAAPPAWAPPAPEVLIALAWAFVAALLLLHQVIGALRVSWIIRAARPVDDPRWLDLLRHVRARVGCRRPVRLVRSPEIDIPSVFGVIRPTVVLPTQSFSWLDDRREAVLQHELIHVVRLDWPVRALARIARALYWFNPLVWWAVRRLELEQELACDEEVLSLGARASTYACHLLGIARSAVRRPAAAGGLAMARRSHLEERIMRILSHPSHRRVGLAVILPAAILTAALVPAIASVQPGEPGPRNASPALRAALAEMDEAEERLEPYLDRIADVEEVDMAPVLEQIEAIEVEIDHEELARIEAEIVPMIEELEERMKPILEQIDSVEIDMEPFHEQIERLHEQLETVTFHVDDGTIEEIMEQVHEQMEAQRIDMESIHLEMAPFQEKIAELHAELEPMHRELARLSEEQHARLQEQLKGHEALIAAEESRLEAMHEAMARVHDEMEPLHEEMERIGARIESALVDDVADLLRSHLGPVTSPGAPFREAAARIVDDGRIHIHDGVLELEASRREVREILDDLFTPERVGTEEAFGAALEAAVDEVADLRIAVD
ncbi:MAG: hypothetical protein MUC56_13820 [Thermoanaerobaculales bacterium]|jgi:beta-lactamase regulating signal transducer with metallopeptidase domain|nr:hypothetical protein [Thermoanaerobaculales bacterium]